MNLITLSFLRAQLDALVADWRMPLRQPDLGDPICQVHSVQACSQLVGAQAVRRRQDLVR